MKKVFLMLAALMLIQSSSYAATADIGEGMARKAGRGFVNLLTGIIELPVQTVKGYNKGFGHIENELGSKTVGTVFGFFRGLSHSAGRMYAGGLELFGFWAANPEDNIGVGIPLDGEYAWDEGERYNIFEPTFAEGWVKPVGKKLGRGLSNAFLGIAEIPGQTMKGASEGNVVKGVLKGFWYFFSREVYGLGTAYTCISPNPPDTLGVAFDQEWPWEALSEEVGE